jgi:hydroxymethylbilane synthase
VSSATLRIGTRGSALALWQAEHVAAALAALPGCPEPELVVLKTQGDRIQDLPLSQVDGEAFFTKEIEDALLQDRVDLAVHSLKDLATEIPTGLTLGAVMAREDPRDVLLARGSLDPESLAEGARVGTSSLRRRALLARWRPDLELAELRGNVPTRIRKLDEGVYDAIVLAAAGVKRLGLEDRVSAYLPLDLVLPAVSQGALGVQIRVGDDGVDSWVRRLDDSATRAATTAERACLRTLEGGCQVPVGALAEVDGEELHLRGVVCSLDGARSVEGEVRGSVVEADGLGVRLAGDLLAQGGDGILEEIRARTSGGGGSG